MLTINNPELEARLSERAAREGVPVNAYAVEVLRREVQSADAPMGRPSARLMTGKYAHVGGTVDEFLKERQAENKREDGRGF